MPAQADRTGGAGNPDMPVASPVSHETAHSEARPLLGYLCVSNSASSRDVEDLRRKVARYAEKEGFTLVRVYVDRGRTQSAGFSSLVAALNSGEASHVVVPALHHLAFFPSARLLVKDMLETQTGARVLVMYPAVSA
jgi:DNA invertase Pin-like site-specific DNA recombinase